MQSVPCRPQRSDFVVVANRLPVVGEPTESGEPSWRRSPGGLVTALEPVLRRAQGVWIGWAGECDRRTAPFSHDGMRVHPVSLSARELASYYEGFSNATVWPLFHDTIVPPTLDRGWWQSYVQVNTRFAEAAALAAAPGATVWVHDYQLLLVPAMLRTLRPDVTIGFFLHIPFPPEELFMQLPWWTEIIDGMLGADLVGFQLPRDAENFRRTAAIRGSAIDPPGADAIGRIHVGGRVAWTGAFPVAVDAAGLTTLATSAAVRGRARRIRAELGQPDTVILSVDRLDYTKGIPERLAALDALYKQGRLIPGRHATVQIVTPSRERIPQYRELRRRIEIEVGHINGAYGALGRPAVHYLHRSVGREELAAFLVATDLMLVTPLRDGMNLVAKEYAACHPDADGALILSEFAGAAAELHGAYLVNPYDTDRLASTVDAVLNDPVAQRSRRMDTMHRQVRRHDVHAWARSYLGVLHRARAGRTVLGVSTRGAALPHAPAGA
ncbi:trehalose-6-phosphate synthase [Tomitella cavernea]|uniref:alpha,alpha-trehalose-phosphate synthase (ADP-forming) n=1 Tax=Tomitella cavernea TaxID=1387982 RepID=A0ABP9D268_9ACTN